MNIAAEGLSAMPYDPSPANRRALPRAIAPAAMTRVTASVGRCGLCGLEKAAWKGQGARLCETCYQREMRRAVEAGEVVAEG